MHASSSPIPRVRIWFIKKNTLQCVFFHASYQVFNSLTCFTGLVRSLPSEEYLATVNDESTGSITCLSCTQATRDQVRLHRMCTGGMELKLWDQLPSSMVKKRARLVRCFFATNKVLAENSLAKNPKGMSYSSLKIRRNCSYQEMVQKNYDLGNVHG